MSAGKNDTRLGAARFREDKSLKRIRSVRRHVHDPEDAFGDLRENWCRDDAAHMPRFPRVVNDDRDNHAGIGGGGDADKVRHIAVDIAAVFEFIGRSGLAGNGVARNLGAHGL